MSSRLVHLTVRAGSTEDGHPSQRRPSTTLSVLRCGVGTFCSRNKRSCPRNRTDMAIKTFHISYAPAPAKHCNDLLARFQSWPQPDPDKLFLALEAAYPDGRSQKERMQSAVIEFLMEDREEKFSATGLSVQVSSTTDLAAGQRTPPESNNEHSLADNAAPGAPASSSEGPNRIASDTPEANGPSSSQRQNASSPNMQETTSVWSAFGNKKSKPAFMREIFRLTVLMFLLSQADFTLDNHYDKVILDRIKEKGPDLASGLCSQRVLNRQLRCLVSSLLRSAMSSRACTRCSGTPADTTTGNRHSSSF